MTSASVVTSVGQANTVVVAKGRIKQIVLNGGYSVGAGIGRVTFEVALNNTSNSNAETATGAPSEVLVGRMTSVISDKFPGNNVVIPCDIPVSPGNQLCINVTQTGSAPSSGISCADVHVSE